MLVKSVASRFFFTPVIDGDGIAVYWTALTGGEETTGKCFLGEDRGWMMKFLVI